jgi:hypothetical protein
VMPGLELEVTLAAGHQLQELFRRCVGHRG